MNHRAQAPLLISLLLLTMLALGACSSQKSGSADRRISATISGLLGSGLVIQLLKPGPFDAWFDYMRSEAANWDGSDLIRNGDQLLGEVLAGAAA